VDDVAEVEVLLGVEAAFAVEAVLGEELLVEPLEPQAAIAMMMSALASRPNSARVRARGGGPWPGTRVATVASLFTGMAILVVVERNVA
jgi:hypothetical protein